MTRSNQYTPAALRPLATEPISDAPDPINDASDSQRCFMAALGLPVPEALTSRQACDAITLAKAEGLTVVHHDAWGEGTPSPATVRALAVLGIEAPATWSEASRLLTACRADGLPEIRCSQGTHPRDEQHGQHRENGTWRCSSCHSSRKAVAT